ncbi:hypothetical protein BT63DRAFT_426514 [Microthyrium microscopicum]|uniref:MARVEL domain-containing protein n=1 Tax=Microthyrium microscopicum TaxID=703497 RepID=A0A6A6U5U7_9PEZI|nr:hypothetical protein BT63DRAFT_426514 [Microthyrium microscopicum]
MPHTRVLWLRHDVFVLVLMPAIVFGQFTNTSSLNPNPDNCISIAAQSGILKPGDYSTSETRGIDPKLVNSNSWTVITVKYSGCVKACGIGPQWYDQQTALNILMTWVVSIMASISTLPFETGRQDHHILYKLRRYFLVPLVNWIGSPQTALACTIYSIHLLMKAATIVRVEERRHAKKAQIDKRNDVSTETRQHRAKLRKDKLLILRNALFIASCLGQYEFPNLEEQTCSMLPRTQDPIHEKRRNRALLFGLLCPLASQSSPPPAELLHMFKESAMVTGPNANSTWTSEDVEHVIGLTKELLLELSKELHVQRRHGMYPVTIGVFWFMIAFAVGTFQSFREVGDYTTAHSLGIGLLLSWLPVVVMMSIADRNPNGVEHCTHLIERWLYNVNAILDHHLDHSTVLIKQWEKGVEIRFPVGQYIGQGRYLHHTGTGEQLMRRIQHVRSHWSEIDDEPIHNDTPRPVIASDTHNPGENAIELMTITQDSTIVSVPNVEVETTSSDSSSINETTPARQACCAKYSLSNMRHESRALRGHWMCSWLYGWLIVSTALLSAFTIAYNTPTIGFGCRATSYLLQWVVSSISWIIIGLTARPSKRLRAVSLASNTLSACSFIMLMLFQVAGVYNNCFCQSSLFGSGGGYVQFAPAAFYEKAYNVAHYWIIATVLGSVSCVGWSLYAFVAWRWSRPLWDEHWGDEV